MLAISVPEIYRAVVYCGTTPSQSFDAIQAPVLAQYAQCDFRTNGNAFPAEKAMTDAGKLAWTHTLDFLKK
jgi:hypothetical protein